MMLDYGSGPGYLFEHIAKLNRKVNKYLFICENPCY